MGRQAVLTGGWCAHARGCCLFCVSVCLSFPPSVRVCVCGCADSRSDRTAGSCSRCTKRARDYRRKESSTQESPSCTRKAKPIVINITHDMRSKRRPNKELLETTTAVRHAYNALKVLGHTIAAYASRRATHIKINHGKERFFFFILKKKTNSYHTRKYVLRNMCVQVYHIPCISFRHRSFFLIFILTPRTSRSPSADPRSPG